MILNEWNKKVWNDINKLPHYFPENMLKTAKAKVFKIFAFEI